MCQAILTYSNVEEIFWKDLTCHMKEHAWPLQEKNIMLDSLLDHNDRHGKPLSNKKLQQAFSRVMEETEEE